jgi:1,4-dihydroxy-2-naphthoate octaprenyltransferase
MNDIRLFIILTRPLFLAGPILLYALGVGIAHYLGISIRLDAYILGQFWVSLLQLSVQYLNEYFNAPADRKNPNRTFLTGGSGAVGPDKLSRRTPLLAALACLAFLASISVVLIARVGLTPQAFVIMILAFLGAFFYSMPPLRLESSGYGELTTSVIVGFLVPAFAYVLQAGELHRLVAMSTFPLTVLLLAMLLAFELPDYATDQKYGKRTLLVRLGWRRGMVLHNILVLSAFLLLVIGASFGFPWFATLPGLFVLPLGLFQIWQMRRIADGAKPNWTSLTLSALALFGSMSYLMAFAFWTN